jgi:ABC-2 type transport system permease protein
MRRFAFVTRAVAGRTLHNAFVNPAILLPSLIFPLFFLVAFAGGLSTVSKLPHFNYKPGYTTFQFVFVFLQSAAFGGVFTGFGIARDFESGFARRLLLAAPRRSGIIAGYAVAAMVRWMFTAAVVTVAALIGGLNVLGGGIDMLTLVVLALLTNLVVCLWACGVAMRLRSQQAGPLMQMPVFLILFLAPVYVPEQLLTGWLHAVAKLNPATALLEAGRSLVAGSPVKVALAFGALGVLGLLFGAWARRGLASAERAG